MLFRFMTHAVLGRKEEEGGKKRSSSSSSECDSLPHPRAAALEPGASRRLSRAAVFRVRSVWPPSRLVSDSCSAGWRKIYRFFFFNVCQTGVNVVLMFETFGWTPLYSLRPSLNVSSLSLFVFFSFSTVTATLFPPVSEAHPKKPRRDYRHLSSLAY